MLTIYYSTKQRAEIHETIRKLFVFQSQKTTDETIALFVDELSKCGQPVGKVIDGIKSLFDKDIKKITLGEIKNTLPMPKADYYASSDSINCRHCNDSGIATLNKKSTGSGYAFRCTCAEGQIQSLAIPLWDGNYEMGDYVYHNKDKYLKTGYFAGGLAGSKIPEVKAKTIPTIDHEALKAEALRKSEKLLAQ